MVDPEGFFPRMLDFFSSFACSRRHGEGSQAYNSIVGGLCGPRVEKASVWNRNFRGPPALSNLTAPPVGQTTFSARAFGGNGTVGARKKAHGGPSSEDPDCGQPSNGGAGKGPQSS